MEKRTGQDVPLETQPQPAPLSNEAVTGYTAALWKYHPVPAEELEPFPECRVSCRMHPGGTVIAANVRGKKHKHEGNNCDDWFEESSVGELVFAAVSDGAGSRKFSRIGARESCRAAVGYLVSTFETLWVQQPELSEHIALEFGDERCMDACRVLAGVVRQAVLKAREAVETAFLTRSADPAYTAALGRPLEWKDFAGTLLVAAVFPAGAAGKLTITCQIGDGIIALIDSKAPFAASVKLMGAPDSGVFSGETEFLISARMGTQEALQSRTKLSRSHSDILLMMTDGVADDYFPHETEIRRLYCDLAVNGILERDTPEDEALTGSQKLPEPLGYPWVNDQSVQIPLHYTRRIMERTGLRLENLWGNRGIMALARRDLAGQLALEQPEARLQRWLDNYVERGSFDDRTLVIVEMKEA